MYDNRGNMSKPWVLFFAGIAASGSGSPIVLTVDGSGNLTPDLSLGNFFVVVLTADATLMLPINVPQDGSAVPWTLLVQQDGVGGHALDSSAYHMSWALSSNASPANTESAQAFSSDLTGTRVLSAPSIDQPIP